MKGHNLGLISCKDHKLERLEYDISKLLKCLKIKLHRLIFFPYVNTVTILFNTLRIISWLH